MVDDSSMRLTIVRALADDITTSAIASLATRPASVANTRVTPESPETPVLSTDPATVMATLTAGHTASIIVTNGLVLRANPISA